jgi:hypothetical protein
MRHNTTHCPFQQCHMLLLKGKEPLKKEKTGQNTILISVTLSLVLVSDDNGGGGGGGERGEGRG